jgi:hypothetical protein
MIQAITLPVPANRLTLGEGLPKRVMSKELIVPEKNVPKAKKAIESRPVKVKLI